MLCGGFGAVLGVGSCSVGLGWFVAGGVGCGRDDCWGFLLGFCAGVTAPLFVAGLPVRHCGFGLWCLMAGEEYGAGGLWRFFWGVLWGVPYEGVVVAGEGL